MLKQVQHDDGRRDAMVTEAEFAALRRDIDHIKDRMAIYDCIASHARGHDRHDDALITGAYHVDGIDEHGPYVNPAAGYADWVNAAHAAGMSVHTHNITTHSCEIDGYVIVCILAKDEQSATFASGRYADRLEKRDGRWRIALRRTINEVTLSGDASWIHSDDCKGYPRGMWSKDDISYRRPLELNPDDTRW
jgi:hypothetical protein